MKIIEYYLMRHASYHDCKNQYVTYYGMLKLKNSVDNLLAEITEKFPQKELRVIHSILPRAEHTVLLMRDMLSPKRMNVSMTSDPRLNSDKLEIDERYIKEIVSSCEKENKICLILSHLPDIEYFCKKELDNSEYICMVTEIEEKPADTENTGDELPF